MSQEKITSITFRCTEEQKKQLQQQAKREYSSISGVVMRTLFGIENDPPTAA